MVNTMVEIIFMLMVNNNPGLINVVGIEKEGYYNIIIIKNNNEGKKLNNSFMNKIDNNKKDK